jgi:hypothetical protein
MDPIQPIEPRSPWISELAQIRAQRDPAKIAQRERRKAAGRKDRKPDSRHGSPREGGGPEEEDTGGRHIDVRA